MNIVIIEDEKILAGELNYYISTIRKDWVVSAMIHSIKEAMAFFRQTNDYQLVFSDIQMGDGLIMDVFKRVKINAPVIFCTAYDKYAIEAFKSSGIDYILKPVNQKAIRDAIEKYEQLKLTFATGQTDFNGLFNLLQEARIEKGPKTSLLVTHRDRIIPIKTEEVALFYIHNGSVSLLDFKKNLFFIPHTIDELEKMVGASFYRVNRQHLVNRKAIKDASQYFSRKLLLNLIIEYPAGITIRKEKITEFLDWLTN